MTIPDHYRKPIFIAVLLHVALFLFLILNFAATHFRAPPSSAPQATIHATAISQQMLDNATDQKQAQESEKIRSQALAQAQEIKKISQVQAQQKLMQKRERIAAAQAQAQAQAQQKLMQKRERIAAAQAQAQAQQKLMQKRERIAAAQASKKIALAQAQQKLQQQLLQQQLSSEQKNISIAMTQAQQGQIDQYKAEILALIQSNWRIDQVNSQLKCIYDVSVAPDGTVLSITLQTSSGNTDLDQSAKQAIEQSSPLPVPQNPNLFSHFRQLVLTLSPQGYLQSVN